MTKRRTKGTEYEKLTASLREFANSLPTETEKLGLQHSITSIIDFLSGIQRVLTATPSRENTAGLEDAFRTLEGFAERAKSNPAIATVLGIPQPRPARPKPTSYTNEETAAARQLLAEMKALPIDRIRSRLQDEAATSLRLLQAVASQLGIRSVQRMARDVLEHQIASRISNYRGYQDLRSGTEGA